MRREDGKAPGREGRRPGGNAIRVVPDLVKLRADLEEAEKVADTTLKAYGALLRRR